VNTTRDGANAVDATNGAEGTEGAEGVNGGMPRRMMHLMTYVTEESIPAVPPQELVRRLRRRAAEQEDGDEHCRSSQKFHRSVASKVRVSVMSEE
jgi:hypothetical protein